MTTDHPPDPTEGETVRKLEYHLCVSKLRRVFILDGNRLGCTYLAFECPQWEDGQFPHYIREQTDLGQKALAMYKDMLKGDKDGSTGFDLNSHWLIEVSDILTPGCDPVAYISDITWG